MEKNFLYGHEISKILRYCEDAQIFDKLFCWGDFYYKLVSKIGFGNEIINNQKYDLSNTHILKDLFDYMTIYCFNKELYKNIKERM